MTQEQEMLAALIVLDEVGKDSKATAADLYARCLARGVDLRHDGKPLSGSPYRNAEPAPPQRPMPVPPSQTAYLCMEHRMGPNRTPLFRGFRIFSSEPWGLSAQTSSMFHTIYYQVSAPTFQEAHDKLLEACRDFAPFQWIWPYVDPSHEAHMARLDRMLEVDRVVESQE